MKIFSKFFLLFLNVVLYTIPVVYGQMAIDNPHSFRKDNWRIQESCNPCHVYYKGSEADSLNRFAISYEEDSQTNVNSSYVSGVSKMCIACHDGIVASFDHGMILSRLSRTGREVAHNHPVSVLYPVGKPGKTKLYNPDSTMSSLGGTIREDLLINGRVECISCHDAHFLMAETPCGTCPAENAQFALAKNYRSLWMTNQRSALCLICHNL